MLAKGALSREPTRPYPPGINLGSSTQGDMLGPDHHRMYSLTH